MQNWKGNWSELLGHDCFFSAVWFLLAFILALPLVICDTTPPTDSSYFYSPMIKAVADGDWEHAFWPMIPPLFSIIGGGFAKVSGVGAFTAAKLVSVLFFALTVIPLYKLHRLLFNRKVANISVLLYLCCSRIMRYAGSGILDTGKLFFLTWVVYEVIVFVDRRSWTTVIRLAIASAGLALIRPEGSCLAPAILILLLLWELFQGEKRFRPVKSLIAGFLCLMMVSPWMYYQYQKTGYPVLNSVQVPVVKAVASKLGGKSEASCPLPQEPEAIQNVINRPLEHKVVRPVLRNGIWDGMVKEVYKGLHPLYLILYLPVIFLRIRRKEFNGYEWFLLTIGILHTLFFIAATKGLWTQKRYIIAVLPLFLGWASIGLLSLWSMLCKKATIKRFLPYLACFAIVGFYVNGLKDLRSSSRKCKQDELNAFTQAVDWFKTESAKMLPAGSSALASTDRIYYNSSKLKISCYNSKLVFMAGGTNVHPGKFRPILNYQDMLAIFKAKSVNFLVLTDRMLKEFPEFANVKNDSVNFRILRQIKEGNCKISIYGFLHNLNSP